MTRYILPVFAAGLVPLAAYLGATRWLGAHPWWAMDIAWIGAALGLILTVAMARLAPGYALPSLILLTGAAYGVAATGKARFATSFGDDALAGQMWYFGWVAAASFAAALLATTAWSLRTAAR